MKNHILKFSFILFSIGIILIGCEKNEETTVNITNSLGFNIQTLKLKIDDENLSSATYTENILSEPLIVGKTIEITIDPITFYGWSAVDNLGTSSQARGWPVSKTYKKGNTYNLDLR